MEFFYEKIISRNLNSFFPSSASSMFPGSHWVSVTSKNSPFFGKDELKMISVSLENWFAELSDYSSILSGRAIWFSMVHPPPFPHHRLVDIL